MEGPQAINGPQLFGWRVAPISVLLTLLAALGILQTIILHGRPVIPRSDDLQQESLSFDMATANVFVELDHDAGTLISIYTSDNWMGIAVTKKFAIYQGIPLRILLTILASVGSVGSTLSAR